MVTSTPWGREELKYKVLHATLPFGSRDNNDIAQCDW